MGVIEAGKDNRPCANSESQVANFQQNNPFQVNREASLSLNLGGMFA
jgi:hypothetical protein